MNETICTEIECYLCYGKGPWGFRFRFKGKGIHQWITLDRWGPRVIALTVMKELGLQRCPVLRRTKTSLRTHWGRLSGHSYGPPTFGAQDGWLSDLIKGRAEASWPCCPVTAGFQMQDSSSLGVGRRMLLRVLTCGPPVSSKKPNV